MKIKMAIAVLENAADVVFAGCKLMESVSRNVVNNIVNITQIKVLLNSLHLLFIFWCKFCCHCGFGCSSTAQAGEIF